MAWSDISFNSKKQTSKTNSGERNTICHGWGDPGQYSIAPHRPRHNTKIARGQITYFFYISHYTDLEKASKCYWLCKLVLLQFILWSKKKYTVSALSPVNILSPTTTLLELLKVFSTPGGTSNHYRYSQFQVQFLVDRVLNNWTCLVIQNLGQLQPLGGEFSGWAGGLGSIRGWLWRKTHFCWKWKQCTLGEMPS